MCYILFKGLIAYPVEAHCVNLSVDHLDDPSHAGQRDLELFCQPLSLFVLINVVAIVDVVAVVMAIDVVVVIMTTCSRRQLLRCSLHPSFLRWNL